MGLPIVAVRRCEGELVMSDGRVYSAMTWCPRPWTPDRIIRGGTAGHYDYPAIAAAAPWRDGVPRATDMRNVAYRRVEVGPDEGLKPFWPAGKPATSPEGTE
jgi:hypothetical protein